MDKVAEVVQEIRKLSSITSERKRKAGTAKRLAIATGGLAGAGLGAYLGTKLSPVLSAGILNKLYGKLPRVAGPTPEAAGRGLLILGATGAGAGIGGIGGGLLGMQGVRKAVGAPYYKSGKK